MNVLEIINYETFDDVFGEKCRVPERPNRGTNADTHLWDL